MTDTTQLNDTRITLLHLNTGRRVRRPLVKLPAELHSALLPIIREGKGAVPAMPQFEVEVNAGPDGAQIFVHHAGKSLITGAVAWGVGNHRGLWFWLQDYFHQQFPERPELQKSCALSEPHSSVWTAQMWHRGMASLEPWERLALTGCVSGLAVLLIQHSCEVN